jgi:hypothetical protein
MKEEFCFVISTIGISRCNTGKQDDDDDDDDDDTGLLCIFITRFLGRMFLPEPNFPLMFTNLHK